MLTLGGGSRRVWGMCEAEKASFFPTGQDLWIYLHLRSGSFTSREWDVLCSAGYYKNTAIVLNFLHFAFHFLETDSAVLDFSLFSLSTIFHPLCLIGWLTAGIAARPPCWNNSSLLALHPSIHQAFDSTASCHPSPTNFSIGSCDSGAELPSSLLLNVTVSCGIILKRTLLF